MRPISHFTFVLWTCLNNVGRFAEKVQKHKGHRGWRGGHKGVFLCLVYCLPTGILITFHILHFAFSPLTVLLWKVQKHKGTQRLKRRSQRGVYHFIHLLTCRPAGEMWNARSGIIRTSQFGLSVSDLILYHAWIALTVLLRKVQKH